MSLFDVLQSNQTTDGKVQGVAIGIVTNNKDSEGMCRVKVKFAWRENSDESYWARVTTFMAGKDCGSFFLPEVGDEVLVAFDQGDIQHPYVIGALWNGKDKAPLTNDDGKNNIRKIKSRSGHEIIFDDSSGSSTEKVQILTKAGHTITMDDSAGKEKIEILDKSKSNSITIDSVQDTITIQSKMQLKIKSQMIEIEADGIMTIKAGGTLTIQGTIVQIN